MADLLQRPGSDQGIQFRRPELQQVGSDGLHRLQLFGAYVGALALLETEEERVLKTRATGEYITGCTGSESGSAACVSGRPACLGSGTWLAAAGEAKGIAICDHLFSLGIVVAQAASLRGSTADGRSGMR